MEDQEERVETTVKYTWTIKNFSKLNSEELYSKTFFTGCHPWRILIFPNGDGVEFLSIYLDAGDTANFPVGWSRSASYKLSLINQVDRKRTITKESSQKVQFNAGVVSRGWATVITLAKFRDPINGFLVKDTCIVVAEVYVNSSVHDNNLSPSEKPPSASFGELSDFKGIARIEKDFVELLEEACSKHPSLIESHRKSNRSQRFIEWSFTALGRVLHFLKTKKVKDMNEDGSKELQNLWEELETVRFDDLTWLEPHVQSALGYMERAEKVRKLKENVADAEANLEVAKLELMKAQQAFVEGDLDDALEYGIP